MTETEVVEGVGVAPHRTNRSDDWFTALYTLSLLFCFSPLKPLAYFLPLAFVFGCLTLTNLRAGSLWRPAVGVGLIGILSLVQRVLHEDFLWINVFLGLLTYSSVLFLFVDLSAVASVGLIHRLFRVTLVVVALEACYGVIQALYSAVAEGGGSFDVSVGDAVKGTINPTLTWDGLGSNQMYAVLMSLFLLILYPSRKLIGVRGSSAWLGWVALSWILASVFHTVLFAIGAVVAGAVLRPTGRPGVRMMRVTMRRIGVIASASSAAVLLLLLLRILFPQNFASIQGFAQATSSSFSDPRAVSSKVVATLNTFSDLPREVPEQPWIGLGLGQYSSRAGLIMSGTYLSRGLVAAPQARRVSQDLIYRLNERVRELAQSSTFFPYYSWLSVYGEFGGLGLLAVAAFVLIVWRGVRRGAGDDAARDALRTSVIVCLVYVLLLGLQDNYWEFTQAVFPPFILAKLAHDCIRGAHGRTAAGATG